MAFCLLGFGLGILNTHVDSLLMLNLKQVPNICLEVGAGGGEDLRQSLFS